MGDRYEPTAPWNEESMDTTVRIAVALETIAEYLEHIYNHLELNA